MLTDEELLTVLEKAEGARSVKMSRDGIFLVVNQRAYEIDEAQADALFQSRFFGLRPATS